MSEIELPDAEQIGEALRLHPATLAIRALEQAPQFVLGIPAAIYFVGDAGFGVALAFAGVGVVIAMIGALLYWLRFSYRVGEEQLVIESGILSRNRRTIPFDRIQDISLEQKLLARLFGVSVVRIETGSSGSDEGELECVSRAEADRLRDVIRRFRAGTAEAAEDEAVLEEAEAPILFQMDPDRLLIAGLFNFSLIFLAIIGAAWQYFGSFLPLQYADPDYWIGRYGDAILGMASVFSAAMLIGVLLVIGMVTGVLRTFLRDWGFRLSRTETGLRRIRGLLTRTDVVMPLRRVQAAIISTGIIRRRWGWHELALQSLGTDGGAGTNHVAVPFARRPEMVPVLGELALPDPPGADAFTGVSRHLITRSWIEDSFLIPIFCAIGYFLWDGGYWLLLLMPLIYAAPIFQHRAHGWRLDGEHLFVRRGILKPRIVVLQRSKIQSASVIRYPSHRPLGTANLLIGTAGAPLASPLTISDLRADEARRLMATLLGTESYRAP